MLDKLLNLTIIGPFIVKVSKSSSLAIKNIPAIMLLGIFPEQSKNSNHYLFFYYVRSLNL